MEDDVIHEQINQHRCVLKRRAGVARLVRVALR